MTNNQSAETKVAINATVSPVGQKLAQIIDDPFASALAATASAALAIGVVLSSIYLISLLVY